MKTKIHPEYYSEATISCACGAVIVAGSTIKEQKTDICSKCHPFYTGKQKLIDTAGRVDKFRARMEAAKAHANKDNLDDSPLEHNPLLPYTPPSESSSLMLAG